MNVHPMFPPPPPTYAPVQANLEEYENDALDQWLSQF